MPTRLLRVPWNALEADSMTDILHMPAWHVEEVRATDHDYYVRAKYEVHPTDCLKCGEEGQLFRNGTTPQVFKDMPIHGKRTRIAIKRPRYMCKACKCTFVQPLPEVHHRGTMTKRLAHYIQREAVRRTFVSIAEEVGVDDQTVRNLLDEHA